MIRFYSEALAEKPEEEWKTEEGDFQILQGVEAHFVKQFFCPHPFPFLQCLNYTLTDKCLYICFAKLSPIFHIFNSKYSFPLSQKELLGVPWRRDAAYKHFDIYHNTNNEAKYLDLQRIRWMLIKSYFKVSRSMISFIFLPLWTTSVDENSLDLVQEWAHFFCKEPRWWPQGLYCPHSTSPLQQDHSHRQEVNKQHGCVNKMLLTKISRGPHIYPLAVICQPQVLRIKS